MIFNSWLFIFVFLPVTLIGFYLLAPYRMVWGQVWLIVASLIFYAHWKVAYLPVLLGSLSFNFLLARVMNEPFAGNHRKTLLAAGLASNLFLLGYFKYTNFFLGSLASAGLAVPVAVDISLPLAISFFTFTQIAYLVDVYRNPTLRYSLLDYTFFVVFFPHLIAGPIVRHNEIIPQLKEWSKGLKFSSVAVGGAMFILGLAKKCLVADALATHVQNVYGAAAAGAVVSQADAWVGTLAFAFQIYFDFSGYSDMALGLAVMFGLRFPVNFNSPYKSRSIIEFWAAWHMTLTRFLREYVYFSLGGNRRGKGRQVVNVLITMLLSGLWHGAGWTFVIWGGLHGCYLVIAHLWRDLSKKLPFQNLPILKWLGSLVTFVFVVLAWVWFRAGHLHTAWSLTLSMLGRQSNVHSPALTGPILQLLLPLLLLGCWLLPNSQQLLSRYGVALDQGPESSGWSLTLNLPVLILFGLVFCLITRELFVNQSTLFIYFKF